jgi:hypothetical protein
LAVERSVRHFALTTDDRNITESPIFSIGTGVDKEEEDDVDGVEEEGYIKKLESSCHTQRLEEVMDRDFKIPPQTNSFQYPPRFVGESNATNTLEPSLENTAELNTGGEGSWSDPSTSNTWPRGYSTWQLTLDGPDNSTTTLYLPGGWRTYTDDRLGEKESVPDQELERKKNVFGTKALTTPLESSRVTDNTTVKLEITEDPKSTMTADDTSWDEVNWVEESWTRTSGTEVGENVGLQVGKQVGFVVGERDGWADGSEEGA